MLYSKERAMAQISAQSLKSKIIPVGSELVLEEMNKQDFEGTDKANDWILCSIKGENKNVKIPVRELFKMTVAGGKKMFTTSEGSDDIKFPKSVTITKAEGRTDREDREVFPVFAYENAQEYLDADSADRSWEMLIEGGLKDNHPFDQVQDYTVSVNF